MANWTTATPTRDQALSDDNNYGSWRVMAYTSDSGGTADLGIAAGGGGISAHRTTSPITVPGVTAPVTGYCITQLDMSLFISGSGVVGGLEFPLGTVSAPFNPGTTTGLASMPTRTILGSSVQLGSLMTWVVVTTALTATTPVLTVTYTNQSGTGSQTCTITLPTNAAVNSAFCLNKLLASGDTGVQAITGLSVSTGSAGVLKVYGFMPIAASGVGTASYASSQVMEPLSSPLPIIKCLPNDIISTYIIDAATLTALTTLLVATPEV